MFSYIFNNIYSIYSYLNHTEDETLRKQVNFFKLMQQWLRFLLHQLNRESSNMSAQNHQNSKGSVCADSIEGSKSSFITDHLSLCLTRHFKCTKCRSVWQTPHISFPVTLIYPFNSSLSNSPSNGEIASSGSNSNEPVGNSDNSFVSFVELLSNSILTEQTIQAHCAQCQKFHNITERRYVSTLPNIFAINTGLDNEMVRI